MKNLEKKDIHKDLSIILRSSLDVHLKKIIDFFKPIVCHNPSSEYYTYSSYEDCEVTHVLNSILNSKIKIIDENKEQIVQLEEIHKQLHDLIKDISDEYHKNGYISASTYQNFSTVEFDFIQELTTIAIESENYEKNFDPLTNVYNRRFFFEKVEYDLKKARRMHLDFSIVMADIDHFKVINDTFGHRIGDEVLIQISDIFADNIRTYDIVARYGGEEFIFFIYADRYETVHIFERIQSIIRSQILYIEENSVSVTCSFGIAQDRESMPLNELVDVADKALYQAKEEGRDKIVFL